jgi:hypothetical protein
MIELTADSLSSVHTAVLSHDPGRLSVPFRSLVQHMSPRPLPLSLAIALAIAAAGGASAWANGAAGKGRADRVANGADDANSLPASVRRIESETGGTVLRAQPIERDGREIYRVKIVTPQGRVRVVEDDRGSPPPPPPPPIEEQQGPEPRHRR